MINVGLMGSSHLNEIVYIGILPCMMYNIFYYINIVFKFLCNIYCMCWIEGSHILVCLYINILHITRKSPLWISFHDGDFSSLLFIVVGLISCITTVI